MPLLGQGQLNRIAASPPVGRCILRKEAEWNLLSVGSGCLVNPKPALYVGCIFAVYIRKVMGLPRQPPDIKPNAHALVTVLLKNRDGAFL